MAEDRMLYQVRSMVRGTGVWLRGARVVRETPQTLLLARVEGIEAGGLVWGRGDEPSRSRKEYLGEFAGSPREAWQQFIAQSTERIEIHEASIARLRQQIAAAETARDAEDERHA